MIIYKIFLLNFKIFEKIILARRAHYNFLENYFDVMILAFIAGIAFPLTSASILYVIVFMRALYTIYYLTP